MTESPFIAHPDLVEDAKAYQANREPPQDLLKKISTAAARAANLQLDLKDKEDLILELKAKLKRLLSEELPALMHQANMRDFTLKGTGNLPDKKVQIKPQYYANIPVGWDEDRKEKAFSFLRDHEGGHLIKTSVIVDFPSGYDEEARKFCADLDEAGFSFTAKKAVSHTAMSKWLRLRVEEGKPIPPLNEIDGVVGSNAIIKDSDR
jgi:hypothetical protein